MSHGDPCISADDIKDFRETYTAVFINHHVNGSLMARMNNVEKAQKDTQEFLEKIDKNIEDLPKKLFLWLSIIVLLLTIFTFLAPSLRKSLNMGAMQPERQVSQDAKIPALGR
jgi:hypothetical protein